MANLFRSREGALSTEDAKTQLTTLGSQTAPGALLVPGAAAFLKAVYVSCSTSGASAVQNAFLVRLEGPGLKRGTFTCAAGASGQAVATGSHSRVPSTRVPVNLPVTPGQEILVFAEALGADGDTHQAGVTLEFGSEVGPEGELKGEVTVEGDLSAVDTLYRLTAQGSITAPSRLTPPESTMLKRVIYSVASDGAADGEVNYVLRLGGDAMKGGEQTIILAAESFIDVASGGDGQSVSMPAVILDNLDLEITPNETLDIMAEMVGVDVGTATIVVTAMFA